MNGIERPPEVRNATILTVLTGGLLVYLGYQSYQMSLIFPGVYPFLLETVIVLFGIATICASFTVWYQKSWAARVITVIGVAACVTLIITGFYLVTFCLVAMYWIAISQIKTSRSYNQDDTFHAF